MITFSPLMSSLVDSSIWTEPYPVRVLWTTMLALKDRDHVVRFNAFGLSRRANMPEQEVLDCLKVLMSPDTSRIEPQPFDGRRIQSTADGYLILNGEKYREVVQAAAKKAKNRRASEAWRNRQRTKKLALVPAKEVQSEA